MTRLIDRFLSWAGFCRHARIAWPQGPQGALCIAQCPDCAKRLVYDFDAMKIRRDIQAGIEQ